MVLCISDAGHHDVVATVRDFGSGGLGYRSQLSCVMLCPWARHFPLCMLSLDPGVHGQLAGQILL